MRALSLTALSLGAVILAGCSTPAPSVHGGPAHHRSTTTAGSTGGSATAPGRRATSTSGATPAGSEGIPAFSHLFVVVMENLPADVAGGVPSLASLVDRYASATSWYAVGHPSLPNYLALVAGSTFGVTSDCTGCLQSAPNLADELTAAGVSWDAYFENMPGPCFLGAQSPDGLYAAKHDPFVYFTDVRAQSSLCSHVQPMRTLTTLLGSPAAVVPRFVWVTPNMCDDGHDCPASTAGAWLDDFVATVTSSPAWSRGGALVVTWDESEGGDDSGVDPATGAVTASGGGGRVLTLVIAPGIAPGLRVGTVYDHYSLLRTIEDAFGLPLLGQAAAPGTRPMSGFWAGG